MEDVLHAEMGGIEMSEWIEYTGSDEQIQSLIAARHGFLIDADVLCYSGIWNKFGEEGQRWWYTKFVSDVKRQALDVDIKKYLICQPHLHADLIKIWADTGCPVWVKVTKRNDWVRYIDGVYYKPRAMVHEYLEPTTKPDWNIPGAEYRLTPFED